MDALNRSPIPAAVVAVDDNARGSVTDPDGRYVIRDVQAGRHRLTVRAVGFHPLVRDTVYVGSGRTVQVDFVLVPEALELPGVAVEVSPDRLLDPREPQTVQQISGAELRELPVTTLREALELQAGVVEGSVRGGRIGQELLVIDGLGIRNQLDAADAQMGIRVPTIALEEATLATNAFSARYGQALSGIITASTRDGGEQVEGRVAFETDRSLPQGWNVGLDRLTVSLGGPVIGPVRFFAALDAQARIDDDPVNAPPPLDSLDPRSAQPYLLPHNSSEQFDLLGKLTVPLGHRAVVRVLSLVSESQQRLFDPELKYALQQGPAQRMSGRLASVHLRHSSAPEARITLIADVRAGYFEKEAIRGPLIDEPEAAFGGFTLSRYRFDGEAIARSRDSAAGYAAIPGFRRPAYSDRTPWGVPAYFMTASPRGELAWNRFREGRLRADLLIGPGPDTDVRMGAEYVKQRVEMFTRLEAYRSVGEGAPPPTLASFSPYQGSAYLELQQRAAELTLTAGLRAEMFNGRSGGDEAISTTKWAVGPRLAVSTDLGVAVFVASWGRFTQPPDYQYLVDAAFADTVRTSRFRRGNPLLGFETATQYELQLRARPSPHVALRAGVYVKQLDGLIASIPVGVDPDSAVFGNGDFGRVKGLELSLEREYRGGLAIRVTYVLQQADATAANARDLYRRLQISPIGDTIVPATVQFPLDYDRRHSITVVGRARVPQSVGRVLAGTELGVVARWGSGLPYTPTNATGDSLTGLPNSRRLPAQSSIDLVVRRVIGGGPLRVGLFADVRNVTNRRNVVAVRGDSGEPNASDGRIAAMAESAYLANPHPIPYESPRYRAWADVDGDGLLAGREELLPLYERAARDRVQALFYYGPPRLVRLGVEVSF